MPKFFDDVFSNQRYKALLKTCKTKLQYNVKAKFKGTSDYLNAIEEFRSFCGENYSFLDKENLWQPVQTFIGALEDANKAFNEAETLRKRKEALQLKGEADKIFNSVNASKKTWIPGEILLASNDLLVQEEELLEDDNDLEYPENASVNYQSFNNGYDEYGYEEQSFTATDDQPEDNDEDELDPEIGLFNELLAFANLPGFGNSLQGNADIENAIETKNTFALLQILLEKINAHQSENKTLKQSLSKALMIAHLLLNKPVIEDDENYYTQLLGYLLQQEPIDESLILEVIKLQVKIYVLHNEDLESTCGLLDDIYNSRENVPQLTNNFFAQLRNLQQEINSYQQAQVNFPYYEDLDNLPKLFNDEVRYVTFVKSYTKDLLAFEPVNSQRSVETVDAYDDQATVAPKQLQLNDIYKELASSEEEQAKREIIVKFLNDAGKITGETGGDSRYDITKLLFLLEQYYKIEKDESLRKTFCAHLVTNAAASLVFSKETSTSLSQYLASANLNLKEDKNPFRYQFFLAVIKQHAHKNALALVKAGKFVELGELFKHIHSFTQKCAKLKLPSELMLTEHFQVEEITVIIEWFNGIQTAESYTQSITSLKEISPAMSGLATTLAIQKLPAFQLLMRLHPKAEKLFAAEFAQTIEIVAYLAMANKNDIHGPLLQLLKACLSAKESELANKILLVFMTLKKPDTEHYEELKRLLSQPENKSYVQTLENLSSIQLDSFNNYKSLLQEATKADHLDNKLINNLFSAAIDKAKDAEELLSLASACKNNPALTEQLARGLWSRFRKIDDLKKLMQRVDCKDAVAIVADEEVIRQLSQTIFTIKTYQDLLDLANYPDGVSSPAKEKVIRDYFAHCQKQASSSESYQAALKGFVNDLVKHQCLPWFIQSILREIIEKTLTSKAEDDVKVGQYKQLLEFIENHLAKAAHSSDLKDTLNQQRLLVANKWIEQLNACRFRLMLPVEILGQRQVLDNEERSKEEFVSIFDKAIESIQTNKLPSLAELLQVNSLFTKLLMTVKEEKENIEKQYAELEKNYKNNLDAFIQNQKAFVGDIDKRVTELSELRQQVVDKKVTMVTSIEEIWKALKENKCKEMETPCQTYFDQVSTKFAEMEQRTDIQLEQLATAKQQQSKDQQELTDLSTNQAQLLSEKMRVFRLKQQAFEKTKKTVDAAAAQIQIQADEAQGFLFEQTRTLKNVFGEIVGKPLSQITKIKQEQEKFEADINVWKDEEEKTELTLQHFKQKKKNLTASIDEKKGELKEKQQELASLSQQNVKPHTDKIQKLSGEEKFLESFDEVIELYQNAINIRKDEQNSPLTKLIYAFAEYVQDISIFAEWARSVMDDYDGLPGEIQDFKQEISNWQEIRNKKESTQQTGQELTFAGEIGRLIINLSNEHGFKTIRNDKRASFIGRWWTNLKLDWFIEDIEKLRVNSDFLIDANATIVTDKDSIEIFSEEIVKLEKQLSDLTQDEKILEETKRKLASDIDEAEKAQGDNVMPLENLELQYKQLLPLYEQLISLVASPLVDTLYENLKDDEKLKQLKERISKDKSSLLKEGIGDNVCANIVYHAVRRGTVEMLEVIFDNLPEQNRSCYLATSIFDQNVATTPLEWAIKHNAKDKIINLLIEKGANVNQQIFYQGNETTTLLLWAYEHDQQTTVNSLLLKGANCKVEDSKGNTLLHCAARKGDVAMIEYLLAGNHSIQVDVKNMEGDDVFALLMKSALPAEKKHELMRKLFGRLNKPTQLDAKYFTTIDEAGNNFLHHAVLQGDLSLVKWLLACPDKVLLNAKNLQGKTPLSLAVEKRSLEIVNFLLHQPGIEGVKEVFLFALQNSETTRELIKVFLANNQFNVSDLSTITLNDLQLGRILSKLTDGDQLMLKAYSYSYLTACASLENVKLLVTNGADPHAADDLGNTVLHHAVLKGDLERVKYLIETCGVDPHPQNKKGITPLMALYQGGLSAPKDSSHRKIIDYLIEKTLDNRVVRWLPARTPETLTQVDGEGNTLLHYVVKAQDMDREMSAIGSLIQQKPKLCFGENPLDHQDSDGKTAMHLLVQNKKLNEHQIHSVLRTLFKGKASLLKDNSGKTPLDYVEPAYFEVITLLIENVPQQLSDMELTPIALKVMAIKDKQSNEKKDFIRKMAKKNGMESSAANMYFNAVQENYNKFNQINSLLAGDGLSDSEERDAYIKKVNDMQSEKEKKIEFTLMLGGTMDKEVAWILDNQLIPFPEDSNRAPEVEGDETSMCLSLVTGTLSEDRKNFWVRVVERLKDKKLTLQDYVTGYTLLHALVHLNDRSNLSTLSRSGVLYVTERDHKGNTVLELTRGKFPKEALEQPDYSSVHEEGQSVYLSILQSMERRLVNETPDVIKQMVTELDFSQITELEMLASFLAKCKAKGQDCQFLRDLTDRNKKSLTESALEALKKNPSCERCQDVLVNLLEVSQIEYSGQDSLGKEKVEACQAEMAGQIKDFTQESTNGFRFTEGSLDIRMQQFDKTLSEKYKELCKKDAPLRQSSDVDKTNYANYFWKSKDSSHNEAHKKALASQKRCGHNMTIYLGSFIEASGMDALVTLPSCSGVMPSLLAVARDKNLPSFYIRIVERILKLSNLDSPVSIVKKAQEAAGSQEVETFLYNRSRLRGIDLKTDQSKRVVY